MDNKTHDFSNGLQINTFVVDNSKIIQELNRYYGVMHENLTRWVMDTRDKSVREVLIRMGWKPPEEG
jgi:hypothetical protein